MSSLRTCAARRLVGSRICARRRRAARRGGLQRLPRVALLLRRIRASADLVAGGARF